MNQKKSTEWKISIRLCIEEKTHKSHTLTWNDSWTIMIINKVWVPSKLRPKLDFPINRLFIHFFSSFDCVFRCTLLYNNNSASFSWIDWHSNRFVGINHKIREKLMKIISRMFSRTGAEQQQQNHSIFAKIWEKHWICMVYSTFPRSVSFIVYRA